MKLDLTKSNELVRETKRLIVTRWIPHIKEKLIERAFEGNLLATL
jgi:hypothetical protein